MRLSAEDRLTLAAARVLWLGTPEMREMTNETWPGDGSWRADEHGFQWLSFDRGDGLGLHVRVTPKRVSISVERPDAAKQAFKSVVHHWRLAA